MSFSLVDFILFIELLVAGAMVVLAVLLLWHMTRRGPERPPKYDDR